MKRGGGLHPARPDCWPPTKRPRATPGGLIAASVTCLSRREGVPPCPAKTGNTKPGTAAHREKGLRTMQTHTTKKKSQQPSPKERG